MASPLQNADGMRNLALVAIVVAVGCGPSASQSASTVGPAGGTIIAFDGRVRLVFPPGAVAKTTTITVAPMMR